MRPIVLGCFVNLSALALVAAAPVTAQVSTSIYAIRYGYVPQGTSVLVHNVVVIGVDIKPSTYGVYVQEFSGGPYSGILAYAGATFPAYTPPPGIPTVGDVIDVQGVYSEFAGLSEITNPVFTKISTTTPPTPVLLPVDSLKTSYAGAERWEGVLVRVDSVVVTSVGNFNDWRFHQFAGPVAGRTDSLAAYEKMVSGQLVPAVGDRLRVVGVADYVSGERRLAPRNNADIVYLSERPPAVPVLAYSSSENIVVVQFNVDLNISDATNASHYSLSTGQPIIVAIYSPSTRTVTLGVGGNLVPSVTPHVLSVSGIRNVDNVPMSGTRTIAFIGGIATVGFVQTPVSSGNDASRVTGQQVSLRGVVTETTGGVTPDFPASLGGFFMQERGAIQYGGIFVFGPPAMPVRGDSVFVTGTVSEFGVGPETEISGVDALQVLGSNRPVIAPLTVSLADASGSNPSEAEKYEGMLIRLASVTSLTQGNAGDPFDISEALAGPNMLRVGNLAVNASVYTPLRGDVLDVAGIIHYSPTQPYRHIEPRNFNAPPSGDVYILSHPSGLACAPSHTWWAGPGIQILNPLDFWPHDPERLGNMVAGDAIGFSVLAEDSDYLVTTCVDCQGRSQSKKWQPPYGDRVEYTWTLGPSSKGKLVRPPSAEGNSALYELPVCWRGLIVETQADTLTLTIANTSSPKAADVPIVYRVVIRMDNQHGSLHHCLQTTVTISGGTPNPDQFVPEGGDGSCEPQPPQWVDLDPISAGPVTIQDTPHTCPDYLALLSVTASDFDQATYACVDEQSIQPPCYPQNSILSTTDPIRCTWSILEGRGSFPVGVLGSAVIFRRSKTQHARVRCEIEDSHTMFIDFLVTRDSLVKIARKPLAFVAVGDDMSEVEAGVPIFSIKAASQIAKTKYENAGYQVVYAPTATESDCRTALASPCYQAFWISGHGTGFLGAIRLHNGEWFSPGVMNATLAYGCDSSDIYPFLQELVLLGCQTFDPHWLTDTLCTTVVAFDWDIKGGVFKLGVPGDELGLWERDAHQPVPPHNLAGP